LSRNELTSRAQFNQTSTESNLALATVCTAWHAALYSAYQLSNILYWIVL